MLHFLLYHEHQESAAPSSYTSHENFRAAIEHHDLEHKEAEEWEGGAGEMDD